MRHSDLSIIFQSITSVHVTSNKPEAHLHQYSLFHYNKTPHNVDKVPLVMSHLPDNISHTALPSKSSLKHTSSRSFALPRLDETQRFFTNEVAIEESATLFLPFFTLIENPSTSEHHHPTVHYIFADDDAEIITEAACRALANDDNQHTNQEDEEAKLPAAVEGVREHYILLDVQPSQAHGYDVAKAHSLSSDWQVMNASISNAPTIDRNDAESGEGLMLKIEGVGAIPQTDSEEANRRQKESLQQMVERFESGLAEIRKMVDRG